MVIRSLAAAALLLAASPAAAHAMLEDASPAVGSRVSAPAQVRLTFDGNLAPGGSTVVVEGPRGFGGVAGVAAPNAYTLVAPLKKPLPPGRYHVRWRVTSSVDHHVNEGDFVFEVAP
jgi:methionine-rich copper-binding protein CopC